MNDTIREFIDITETMFEDQEEQETLMEEFSPPEVSAPVVVLESCVEEKLDNLIFKLRSYRDPDVGEYAAGVEAGMSRAADMLQNLINRLKGE